MRVVICWAYISGYMSSCWRALAERMGDDLFVIAAKFDDPKNPGFNDDVAQGFKNRLLTSAEYEDYDLVSKLVTDFKPDVVVVCGWVSKVYIKLALDPQFASIKFVMTMDTPWKATVRQQLARLKIGSYLDRMSAVVVAGERSWQYARRLRISADRIYRGMYGVDYKTFSPIYQQRRDLPGGWPKQFLFSGRYLDIKGVDILVEGYRKYRDAMTDPWPLISCGSGELSRLFDNVPGVTNRGFVQPRDLPDIWRNAGVFVLPSRYDPWPLVVVEAASAGLPVICTEACGSAVEVVRDVYSGRVIATGSVEALTAALCWAHRHYEDFPTMGGRAQHFAAAYSSQMWAERWLSLLQSAKDTPVEA